MMLTLRLAVLCALGLTASAQSFDIPSHYTKHEYKVEMRDGVHLFMAVYVPNDASPDNKYPFLMTRTPYSIAPYGEDKFPAMLGPGQNFAQEGFIFVVQDVRGRNMSEGTFVEERPEPDQLTDKETDESTDTYDTIEWLLKNVPNNNGRVGLVGTSYPGFYTDTGVLNAHPALVAASPQAPMTDLFLGDDAYHNGAFMLVANFDFYTGFNKQDNPVIEKRERKFDYGTKDGYEFYLNMGPVVNSDEKYLHFTNPYWTDVYKHDTYDEYWRSRNLEQHLKDIRPAILVVGGWFDAEDLQGTLKTFRAIKNHSPATSDKLVMGPWAHGGWLRRPGDKLGDIKFGADNSTFFQTEIELPFFRHYLKAGTDAELPNAYVFETGKNIWQKHDSWPPANAAVRKLYFQASGKLSFTAPSGESGFDEYISDPANPVPFYSKPTLDMAREYMDADQRFVQGRSDVLTYLTEPLSDDLTVAGPISPTLFVSTTGTDSDFVVKLIDVYPDSAGDALGGYQQLVRGEPFRGKFRNSFEHPEPFTPGTVSQIHFAMPDVYHCFQKGHRIMIQVQSSWFPLVDRNPQTFTDIPYVKPDQFQKATERLYRAGEHSSFVAMGVVQ
ncbi:MAG TPA: CocE/NonD family hydrolase [Bryobacteraceae bacterium]|nr:CocE/NonD family hydrolase [Bryobacteraceae bacterium]